MMPQHTPGGPQGWGGQPPGGYQGSPGHGMGNSPPMATPAMGARSPGEKQSPHPQYQ